MCSSPGKQVSLVPSHLCLIVEGKGLSQGQSRQLGVSAPDLLVSASSESFATSPEPLPLPGISPPFLMPVSGPALHICHLG